MPDFTGLRKVLEENGEKWYVLYRAHRYSEDDSAGLDPECSADVTDYPDMQELLAATDMLITDYSSCIWDYSFFIPTMLSVYTGSAGISCKDRFLCRYS